jgi:hypothetical protein
MISNGFRVFDFIVDPSCSLGSFEILAYKKKIEDVAGHFF